MLLGCENNRNGMLENLLSALGLEGDLQGILDIFEAAENPELFAEPSKYKTLDDFVKDRFDNNARVAQPSLDLMLQIRLFVAECALLGDKVHRKARLVCESVKAPDKIRALAYAIAFECTIPTLKVMLAACTHRSHKRSMPVLDMRRLVLAAHQFPLDVTRALVECLISVDKDWIQTFIALAQEEAYVSSASLHFLGHLDGTLHLVAGSEEFWNLLRALESCQEREKHHMDLLSALAREGAFHDATLDNTHAHNRLRARLLLALLPDGDAEAMLVHALEHANVVACIAHSRIAAHNLLLRALQSDNCAIVQGINVATSGAHDTDNTILFADALVHHLHTLSSDTQDSQTGTEDEPPGHPTKCVAYLHAEAMKDARVFGIVVRLFARFPAVVEYLENKRKEQTRVVFF